MVLFKQSSVVNDQWGKSHFNWKVGNSNYHILRTGCYPYIKYHCTQRQEANLIVEDYFFRLIKLMNLGDLKSSNLLKLFYYMFRCSSCS